MNATTENNEIARLIEVIENLNSRISAIEASMSFGPVPEAGIPRENIQKESSEDLEFRIGEQWFGKIGIAAFVFAFFYLLTFSFAGFVQSLVIAGGILTAAVLVTVSFRKSEQLKSLSGYLAGSGMIIFFLSVLKLHYFSDNPVAASMTLAVSLLYISSFISLYAAVRKNSAYLVMIALAFTGITALLSDIPAIVFITLVLFAAAGVIMSRKYNWESLITYTIPAVYLFLFLWFINNPVAGNDISARADAGLSILIIPLFTALFGFTQAGRSKDTDDYFSVFKSMMNAVLGYMLFVFTVINSAENSAMLNFGVSVLILSIAARYWSAERSKISTFIYSMVGYGALSFAIIQNFKSPDSYILLSWQSLLVVSTALWFRSRFIVVTNFFIFLTLTVVYLSAAGSYDVTSLSFGIVALISARLINIHQLRLELQSEQLRNAYLVLATLFIPFILYSILPSALVGISWIALAFFYYFTGKLLNNKKYRLMASATLIMSLAYIFIFGLTSSDTTYKIISFMLVSIALLIISVVYARVRRLNG